MTGNFDINKELLDAMRIIARQEIEKCNRDITKTARVIAVNTDKTVKIEMDGKQYDNIPNYNGTTLSVNNIVKVTYPQGQASNMYVSGGGEDEIYSNLEKFSSDIQAGTKTGISAKGNSIVEYAITFEKEFSKLPEVVATLHSGTTNPNYGYLAPIVWDVTTTGFKIRIANAYTETFAPDVTWVAVAK